MPSVRRFHVGKLATVSFGTESRVAEDESWTVVDRAELSNTVPWRTFRWYKGQRHYSGMYCTAAMRGHVVYESRLELARLMFADPATGGGAGLAVRGLEWGEVTPTGECAVPRWLPAALAIRSGLARPGT